MRVRPVRPSTDLGEGALGRQNAVDGEARDAQDGGERDAPADDGGPGRVLVRVVGQRHVVDQAEHHDELAACNTPTA